LFRQNGFFFSSHIYLMTLPEQQSGNPAGTENRGAVFRKRWHAEDSAGPWRRGSPAPARGAGHLHFSFLKTNPDHRAPEGSC